VRKRLGLAVENLRRLDASVRFGNHRQMGGELETGDARPGVKSQPC
jgi:hypothetical protein